MRLNKRCFVDIGKSIINKKSFRVWLEQWMALGWWSLPLKYVESSDLQDRDKFERKSALFETSTETHSNVTNNNSPKYIVLLAKASDFGCIGTTIAVRELNITQGPFVPIFIDAIRRFSRRLDTFPAFILCDPQSTDRGHLQLQNEANMWELGRVCNAAWK